MISVSVVRFLNIFFMFDCWFFPLENISGSFIFKCYLTSFVSEIHIKVRIVRNGISALLFNQSAFFSVPHTTHIIVYHFCPSGEACELQCAESPRICAPGFTLSSIASPYTRARRNVSWNPTPIHISVCGYSVRKRCRYQS